MRNLAITILINIFILNMLSAQNGKFVVEAFLYEVDSELGKVYVDLKIKASAPDTEFYLANQNYRLSFNRAAFVPGSASIESELDISGGTETPENFSLYASHTLLNQDTIISYNVELLSENGRLITDKWLDIGRISLDIANPDKSFSIYFHRQEVFPPTYISEVLDPITHIEIGGAYGDLEGCLSGNCEDAEQLPVSVEFVDYQNNIQILPTAVHSELTVQYTLQGPANMTRITIADMQGRVLQQHQKQLTGQENTFKFDVAHLPQGIYLVNTLIDGQWIPRKFVKI